MALNSLPWRQILRNFSHRRASLISLLLCFWISGCGGINIGLGGGSSTGDPRPTGNPIKYGQFPNEITGTAFIFFNGTSYILRLEGMNFGSYASLPLAAQVFFSPPAGGSQTFILRSTYPNQNYTLSTSGSLTFSYVSIISSQVANTTYSTALFQ